MSFSELSPYMLLSCIESFPPFDLSEQIKIRVKVVSSSSSGVVAAEVKKAQSNWIILDK